MTPFFWDPKNFLEMLTPWKAPARFLAEFEKRLKFCLVRKILGGGKKNTTCNFGGRIFWTWTRRISSSSNLSTYLKERAAFQTIGWPWQVFCITFASVRRTKPIQSMEPPPPWPKWCSRSHALPTTCDVREIPQKIFPSWCSPMHRSPCKIGRFRVLPEPQRIPSCRTENMILSGSKVFKTSKPKIFHAKQNLGPLLCVRRSPLLQRGCYIQHPMHLQKKTSTKLA